MSYKAQNPFQGVQDSELTSEKFARKEDEKDALSKLRNEFIIPTKGDLRYKRYGPAPATNSDDPNGTARPDDSEESIYFCGNSLGLQPRRTRDYIQKYLDTWASKGVFGHFKELEDGHPPWLQLDDALKEQTAKIVGALPSEVVVMETLTANLHLLMASFYRPTKDRYKIIIEEKAFPSDHVSPFSFPYLLSIAPSVIKIRMYTKAISVCRALTTCPPQRPCLRPNHHNSTLVILTISLQRTYTLHHLSTCSYYRPGPSPRNPVLLRTALRHRPDNATLPLTRYHGGLGPRTCCRKCASQTPRLERRLRRMVQLQVHEWWTGRNRRSLRT